MRPNRNNEMGGRERHQFAEAHPFTKVHSNVSIGEQHGQSQGYPFLVNSYQGPTE